MFKKMLCVALVLGGGFSVGYYGIVFAYAIPGIDEPYNPPAYYSDTAISYEDSPSPFFFKDLARGGKTVLDKTRKMKSVLFSGDFTNLSSIFTTKTDNDVTDTTPFEPSILDKVSNALSSITNRTADTAAASGILDKRESTLFRSPDRYDEDTTDYNAKTQLRWLQQTYLNLTQTAKDDVGDLGTQTDTLNDIVTNAYAAEGDLQANQASAQIKAFNAMEETRRNTMLANYTALRATHNMTQEDEELKNIRTINRAGIEISDPYNPSQQEKSLYTRPEAPGFKDF
jgi:conjugal transfer/entry exclusion protein